MSWWNNTQPKLEGAALRVFNIAKNAGDAVSAIEITNRMKVPLSDNDCGLLWNAVLVNAAPSARARNLLVIIGPWSVALGTHVGMEKINYILSLDPSLWSEVAMNPGVSDGYRLPFLQRMLKEKTLEPRRLYNTMWRISLALLDKRPGVAEQCITYALEQGDVITAYDMAYFTRSRGQVSPLARERVIQALLALPGKYSERLENQDRAFRIA